MAETKTQRASAQKVVQARARGALQPSALLCAAGALSGLCVAGGYAAPLARTASAQSWHAAMTQIGAMSSTRTAHDMIAFVSASLDAWLTPCATLLAGATLGAVVAGVIQLAGARAAFGDADRFNPAARIASLFSVQRASSALSSAVALVALLGAVLWTIAPNVRGVLTIAGLPHARALQALCVLLETLVVRLALVALVLGVLDAIAARARFYLSARMTQRELREEQREQYGDPHVRAERARRARSPGARL